MSEKFSGGGGKRLEDQVRLDQVVLAKEYLPETKEKLEQVELTMAKRMAQMAQVQSWFPFSSETETSERLDQFHKLMCKWGGELDELEKESIRLMREKEILEEVLREEMN